MEGITLGQYRLIEQVGEGGMATVYKAYQPRMDRFVAVKVIPAYRAKDPNFVERFKREARTIARLEHQNILPVHDFGEQDGTTYLVMRYLEGGTLKDVMRHGRLTVGDAIRLIEQVCAALDYAHRHGVIHRDVKPANILIDAEGAAYLSDFGIAKAMMGQEQASLTATGATIGTPAYMPPEQSMGTGIDARSDIYALGVVLYEMLVGVQPFVADTPMAVALAHIHEPLPLPRQRNPDIPAELENVILKALAKEPDERFQTAAEMADALRNPTVTAGLRLEPTTLNMLVAEAKTERMSRTVPIEQTPIAEVLGPAVTPAPPPPEAVADDAAPEPAEKRRVPRWALVVGVALVVLLLGSGVMVVLGVVTVPGVVRRVSLPANVEWLDTGMTVQAGRTYRITASGEVTVCESPAYICNVGPNGNTVIDIPAVSEGSTADEYPLPQVFIGVMVGRVGDGEPFPIGSGRYITPGQSGRLYLTLNDNNFANNGGELAVRITQLRREPAVVRLFPCGDNPEVAAGQPVVLRYGYSYEDRGELAEVVANEVTFSIMVDGNPVAFESLQSPMYIDEFDPLACIEGEAYVVWWDAYLGPLPAGEHELGVEYILNGESLGVPETVITVGP